ncbi:MAG: hypothetical protein IJH07_02870 [Ruminococcus sp.]|nr:hypothetical protein [Ruminococcus sp.]
MGRFKDWKEQDWKERFRWLRLDIWFFLFDNALLNILMRHPTLTAILSSVIGAIGGSLLIAWLKHLL